MTNQQAIDRVLSRLDGEAEKQFYPADILAIIPDALQKFARMVADDPELAPLLRKDFSITISGGTGSLLTALTAAEPLLADFLPSAYMVTSSGVQVHYLRDRTQLNLTRPSMIPYWINDQSVLRTRNTDGSLTSLNTTITATAQYTPTIGDVPVQIEELFVSTLAEMVQAPLTQEANG